MIKRPQWYESSGQREGSGENFRQPMSWHGIFVVISCQSTLGLSFTLHPQNSEIEHDHSSDKLAIGIKFPKYEHKHALGLKYIVPA